MGQISMLIGLATILQDKKGKLIGYQSSVNDITEQKQAVKKLQASEELYKKMVENSPLGMHFYRLQSDGKLVFVRANPAADKLLGIDNSMFKGKTIEEAFPPLIQTEIPQKYIEVAKNGITFSTKQLMYEDEKISGVFEVYAFQTAPGNMVSVFSDVTAQKLAEEEIQYKNVHLSELNAQKDKFFSIIAHDLRSPFTGFLGFTDLLKSDLYNMPIDEIKDIADRMNSSARNLFGLLTNLLEWSMSQRGLTAFHPEKISVKEITDSCIEYFHEAAKKKGIELNTKISKDVFVKADKDMLNTILRNLISNAFKFTKKDGLITISAKVVNDKVNISIKDTGIGMNENLINNLFRLDNRTIREGTDDEPSTGLGLLLCKEFLGKHNGKIWVISEEGKGSEFKFSLPLDN